MLVDTMCKCKHIYKYVLPIYENVSKSCKCPHEFACMLALEWAARYLGKDPSQLSSQICQVAILCRSFQIASTCTSLAKFEAQFTTELLLTLVISCETAISHTKCPGGTPHRPQDQFGAKTCKAQLWIWKCKDPSLGKWRRNCKGVSRWKVRFMHEAWRYQWCLWQISNNTVASGFCIIHSGIHSYISCLDYIKLSFHPNPHHSQTYIKNFQGTGLHEKQTWIMNLQVASSAQSTAFCSLNKHPQPVPSLQGSDWPARTQKLRFPKNFTEISGKCGGHAWMINLVVLVNPVVGETERCQGEKDRSR